MTREQQTRYPWFGVPPAREPRPAAEEPALPGKRVILSTPDGFVYDMRAVSPVHLDSAGREVVDVVTEESYFRWMWTDREPQRSIFLSRLVWVE